MIMLLYRTPPSDEHNFFGFPLRFWRVSLFSTLGCVLLYL